MRKKWEKKWEVGSEKWEVGSEKWEVGSEKRKNGDRETGIGDRERRGTGKTGIGKTGIGRADSEFLVSRWRGCFYDEVCSSTTSPIASSFRAEKLNSSAG
jgi:hypothetical protein